MRAVRTAPHKSLVCCCCPPEPGQRLCRPPRTRTTPSPRRTRLRARPSWLTGSSTACLGSTSAGMRPSPSLASRKVGTAAIEESILPCHQHMLSQQQPLGRQHTIQGSPLRRPVRPGSCSLVAASSGLQAFYDTLFPARRQAGGRCSAGSRLRQLCRALQHAVPQAPGHGEVAARPGRARHSDDLWHHATRHACQRRQQGLQQGVSLVLPQYSPSLQSCSTLYCN